MPSAMSTRLREIVAGLVYSPLYFNLTVAQRLAMVKALARRTRPLRRLGGYSA